LIGNGLEIAKDRVEDAVTAVKNNYLAIQATGLNLKMEGLSEVV